MEVQMCVHFQLRFEVLLSTSETPKYAKKNPDGKKCHELH